MITKTANDLMGVHYCIEEGREVSFSQVGVPEGTTILVKNLFFHTPVRKKFLKSAVTEGGYIADLCEHLAMSKPQVSFRFVVNGQVKFHTSGSGDVKEIIYRIFGRDFIKELVAVDAAQEGIRLWGYLGKPALNRSNRNYENCFINGRYVKSSFLSKAMEEGYRAYLMQHKFPFAVIYLEMDTEKVDVNVHPTKMDIRISDSQYYYDFIVRTINRTLKESELIPDMEQVETLSQAKPEPESLKREDSPEPFEKKRIENQVKESFTYLTNANTVHPEPVIKAAHAVVVDSHPIQMNLFDEKILKTENKDKFNILGQVFSTYWLVSFEDRLLFVDQHAAHEKVKYERLMAAYRQGETLSQSLQPPLIFHLTQKEEATLTEYGRYFEALGFAWEDFGDHAIAMRAMPLELYGKSEKGFFEEILDELMEDGCKGTPEVIQEKIASMSCKAAVKGNQEMDSAQMTALMEQLLELDNPYHCPHGRPTMISISQKELEKKFKRIV
jgi:DNA mismatch repair protein MutL